LGFCAGYNETGSSRLHIANSQSCSLIYGEFDNKLVCVDEKLSTCQLQITSGASEGYVLTSDSGGTATWEPASAGNQTIAFNQLLPFTHLVTVMEEYTITGATAFTADTTTLVDGARVIVVLKADGTNVPTFSAQFEQTADSLEYSNVTNEYNTIDFIYDGRTFWYKIYNSAGTNIVYEDEVLTLTNSTAFNPTLDYHPSTKKYVDDEIMEKIANYYPGSPVPSSGDSLGYYGVLWNENYPNSGTLRTGTLSGYIGGGYYNEFGYSPAFKPNSNVPNDKLFIHNRIKRCILTSGGSVNYYLDPYNSYNKDGVSPSIFGTVTTAGRTSLTATNAFTGGTSADFVGRYVHITTTGKTHIYAMITAKASDDQLTISDPRTGSITSNIFEIGDTFEICTAVLNGDDGDVMVEIPKFYVRYITDSGANQLDISIYPYSGFTVHEAFVDGSSGLEVDHIYYSAFEGYSTSSTLYSIADQTPANNKTRNVFRSEAANKGTGWVQEMFWYRSALQTLFFVEFADLNSDYRLPAYVNRSSFSTNYYRKTGRSLGAGNLNTSIDESSFYDEDYLGVAWVAGTNTIVCNSYRGVENFWGSIWKWTDGLNVNDRNIYTTNNKSVLADDTAIGYDDLGILWASSSDYIKTVHPIAGAFLPLSTVGASSSTYFCDYAYINTSGWRVLLSGGYLLLGSIAGVVCCAALPASSFASASIGARLCF
jgi:hypothetical protein